VSRVSPRLLLVLVALVGLFNNPVVVAEARFFTTQT
jgi:hypothetical protein